MPMTDEEVTALKAEHDKAVKAKDDEHAKTKAELEKLTKKSDPKKEDDADLADKARLEREASEKKAVETKVLETALKFNLASVEWLKTNASLLPSTIDGIFKAAEKEKYGSEIEKAADIKLGIVSEFFAIQANLDQLTGSQKQNLADFLALTKNVKQERVHGIYDSIFEPTLESIRKVKKAEALQKGLAAPDATEDAYQKRLIEMSRKHHLREKANA